MMEYPVILGLVAALLQNTVQTCTIRMALSRAEHCQDERCVRLNAVRVSVEIFKLRGVNDRVWLSHSLHTALSRISLKT